MYKYVKIAVESYFLRVIIVIALNTQQRPLCLKSFTLRRISSFSFFFFLMPFNVINTRQSLISASKNDFRSNATPFLGKVGRGYRWKVAGLDTWRDCIARLYALERGCFLIYRSLLHGDSYFSRQRHANDSSPECFRFKPTSCWNLAAPFFPIGHELWRMSVNSAE